MPKQTNGLPLYLLWTDHVATARKFKERAERAFTAVEQES